MHDSEDCHRPPRLSSRPGMLSASLYNKAHTLLTRRPQPIYVAMRGVSLMAIMTSREWAFCDFIGGRITILVWRDFNPHARSALDEPVPCVFDLHTEAAEAALKRLPREFEQALDVALGKTPLDKTGVVLPLARKDVDKHESS